MPKLTFEEVYHRSGLVPTGAKTFKVVLPEPSLWDKYQNLLQERPFAMSVYSVFGSVPAHGLMAGAARALLTSGASSSRASTDLLQSGTIAAAGNVTAQLLSGSAVSSQPVIEQILLTVTFVAPVCSLWFPTLGSLQLHWTLATAVDQFLFSPVFNIAIFLFISAAFKGGVTFTMTAYQADAEVCTTRFFFRQQCVSISADDRVDFTLSVHPNQFAPLSSYAPVWSTQVNAYYLWLPATIVREAFVPGHLKGIFVNLVSFVWSIIFSFILAASG